MKNIEQISYKNAEQFKLKNARIEVISLPTGEYGIMFKILSKDTEPRTTHTVFKNKIVATHFKISKEAAISLIKGLGDQLTKDGVI